MLADGHGDNIVGSQLIAGAGTLFAVASTAPGHTYIDVVNDGSGAASTTISLTGQSGASGATATVLSGDPTATNSLSNPTLVAPKPRKLGSLGSSFTYGFPANSLTVLDLRTAGGTTAVRPLTSSSPRTVSAAQISRAAVRSDVGSMRTTTFDIQPDRSLDPATATASGSSTINLASRGPGRHDLVVRTPRPRSIVLAAHGRASVRFSGLKPGRYAIDVDGTARGMLVVTNGAGP
jgi:hypothetical protein